MIRRVVKHDKIEAAHFVLKHINEEVSVTPEKQLADFMTENLIQKENVIYIDRNPFGNYVVLIYEKVELVEENKNE